MSTKTTSKPLPRKKTPKAAPQIEAEPLVQVTDLVKALHDAVQADEGLAAEQERARQAWGALADLVGVPWAHGNTSIRSKAETLITALLLRAHEDTNAH